MNLKYYLEKFRILFNSKIFFGKKKQHYQDRYAFFSRKDDVEKKQKELIKKIQHKIDVGQKVVVYFVAYEKAQWTFDPVYDELKKDDRFDLKVFVLDAFERKGTEDHPTEDLIFFSKIKISTL